jgi:hypothetical protein
VCLNFGSNLAAAMSVRNRGSPKRLASWPGTFVNVRVVTQVEANGPTVPVDAVQEAGLRISSGLALIGAVVAEFVAGTGGRSSGLAYLILNAGFQLDIPLMFAALALIAVLGITMFLLLMGLTQLLLGHWHESAISEHS